MRKPDFFIVGAPKCGTTFLNDYLHAHPDIFMAKKEIHFFGSDLGIIQPPLSEEQYLAYFSEGAHSALLGESSAWYLFSKRAAREIHAFNPRSKIIIMLRNPVDMIRSLHRQFIFDLDEHEPDFERAISLEGERRAGKKLPDSKNFNKLPSYIESATYAPQLKSYLDVFGREAVHIILFEDIAENAHEVYSGALQFLGAPPFVPARFEAKNVGRDLKNLHLHRTIDRPSPAVKTIVRTLIPSKRSREKIAAFLYRRNIRYVAATPISEAMEKKLAGIFEQDIREVEKLIGRNLQHWLPC
ncbi:MAG: sulfotransferase domain-containing protein [Flavobacteriales bacterium]